MTGGLVIFNVGAGDIELRFNPHQPEELERGLRILIDMQRQGYAILVKQEDGSYARATRIDATRGVYIIAGSPTPVIEGQVVPPKALPPAEESATRPPRRRGRPPGRRREQPIESSHAVGIGRSAGG